MHHLPSILAAILTCIAAHSAAAQGPGAPFRFFKVDQSNRITLETANGTEVHSWPAPRRGAIDMFDDGTLLTAVVDAAGTGVQRLAFDGSILWDYRTPAALVAHHDIEALPNGNALLIVEETASTPAVVAAGRDPSTVPRGAIEFDAIIEVQPTGPTTGAIVWEWHVTDHLIQDFDPTQANFGAVAAHPELVDINYPSALFGGIEFNHANGVDYDPVHDRIVLSSPAHDEIWILDHSTTSAEAAAHTGGRWGRGGDLLYRWGNPEAYRAGPASARQLGFQHDPRFVPQGYPGAGNVTVFNNRFSSTQSAVFELVLPLDANGGFVLDPSGRYGPTAPVWSYTAPGFRSLTQSSAQRLPNGNTLICSAAQRRIFDVTPAGAPAGKSRSVPGNVFHAHHTQRSLWLNDETPAAAAGLSLRFGIEAGPARAGQQYVLLGSSTGTNVGFSFDGIAIPLNRDPYLFGTLESAGRGVFSDWLGTLDRAGGASASLAIPALPALAGITLHHAFVTRQLPAGTLTFASNAVPLRFR